MSYPSAKKRKYGDDDSDEYSPPRDSYSSGDDAPKKSKKSKKKRLTSQKRNKAKKKSKKKVRRRIRDDLTLNPLLFAPAPVDLSPHEVLVPANYTEFADPAGCPGGGGYKGCQRVTMTLGPKQQFGQAGTNSSGTYPLALAQAVTDYQGLQIFKSGHVLNADFGGLDASENMTILTSSANVQQQTFDNNVKNAQNALYNVYEDLASLGPLDPGFFTALGYGISIDIQMTGGVWGAGYPANCISNQMVLVAAIVGEANVTAAITPVARATNFSNPRPSVINYIPSRLLIVQGIVAKAMAGTNVDNREY